MVQTGRSYRNRGVGHSVQVGFIEIGGQHSVQVGL